MMQEHVSNLNITYIVNVDRNQLQEEETKNFKLEEHSGDIEAYSNRDINIGSVINI